MELNRRKSLRMKNHDYSQDGAYFITICVTKKHELLWETNAVGANCVRPGLGSNTRPLLSDIGLIIENEIALLSKIYDGIWVDKFVIMPNHLHMIIAIDCKGRQTQEQPQQEEHERTRQEEHGRTQFAPTISRVIKQFKGSITKQIGYPIWQRSYHDHIIQNHDDYLRICRYIDDNPLNWEEDDYFPRTQHTGDPHE